MKQVATSAIILVQLWMLAPVCCCWFKAEIASRGESCCCSPSNPAGLEIEPAPPKRDTDCHCSESKIELPPQAVVKSDLTSQRLALELLSLGPERLAASAVAEPSGRQDPREWSPRLSVAGRLSSLQRLNL